MMSHTPVVHRFQAGLFPVNAYLVETTEGIVALILAFYYGPRTL
jgi:hypothetical protein